MQGLSTRDLMLILQKQLSPSGVSSLGRIVLPKVVGGSFISMCIMGLLYQVHCYLECLKMLSDVDCLYEDATAFVGVKSKYTLVYFVFG